MRTARSRALIRSVLAAITWGASIGFAQDPSDPEVSREAGEHFGPGATGAFRSQNGMVSTASLHASLIGLEILRQGGNAFDAAVAVQFALNVTEPYGSGIGGGLFVVAYNAATGEVISLDGREESPAAFELTDLLNESGTAPLRFRQRITGGAVAGVPGALAACVDLLQRHGSMSLAEVIAPAIRLAEDGFAVTQPFADNLQAHWNRLSQDPASARVFGRLDGNPLQAGDWHRNPDLAETFRLLAEHGADVFYRGKLASEIVAAVAGSSVRPGRMTLDDLANYKSVWRHPVKSHFRDYTIYGMGMPSSGGVALAQMLSLLEIADYGSAPFLSSESISMRIAAQNLAFADRNAYLADADFADVPVAGLLDRNYLLQRASLILNGEALRPPLAAGNPPADEILYSSNTSPPESPSTTHFSIVDKERNLVAVTSTLEQHFGAAITVPGRGFLLNNQLTDFNPSVGEPNSPEPGLRRLRTAVEPNDSQKGTKRPRSSMAPTIVLHDNQPFLVIGSPGGSRIIGVILNALLNCLVYEQELQSAVNAPRVISRNSTPELETPLFNNRDLMSNLAAKGIQASDARLVGAVQAIQVLPGGWLLGAADPRREGMAIGY